MNDTAPQVSIVMPHGAPADAGALEWVMASVTPPDGFLGAEVHVDGKPIACAMRRLPGQIVISTWCDTRGLPPALHDVTVEASYADGRRVSDSRLLHVALGQRAELTTATNGAADGVGVAWMGAPDLDEQLARTALGGPPLVLLEDDVSLAPNALHRIAAAFDDVTDVVIGDEASMISESRWIRWRKRAFQPEALPSVDGVGPLLAVGPRAADILCDALPPAAGLYGLALELVDRGLATIALPFVLSLTADVRVPTDEPDARAAVERLAARRGRPVAVTAGPVPGLRDVRWPLADPPPVVAVIPSRTPALAAASLAGLAETTDYDPLRVVVVDSSPDEDAMLDVVAGARLPATCLRYPSGEPFNYQRAVNMGSDAAGDADVLFLNDDVVPLTADWLTRMAELLTLPGVGIVGAFLLHPGGTIQHAGVQVNEGTEHRYHDAPGDARGHRFELLMPGNPEAVTGACMLTRREVLDELSGHDENYTHVYGDVDLCFRAAERGWRVAWCAGAKLEHAESASFGSAVDVRDIEHFALRWRRDRDLSLSTRVRS